MSGDYKYDIQVIAEELAEEDYNKDYYSMSRELQRVLYDRAMREYVNRRADWADCVRKAERER